MKMRNQYWLLAGILTLFTQYAASQTTLFPGDLALIGINTSNGACSGNSGEDLISFVCLKTIQTGTTIDLTDNGWERLNPNTFGNAEGILRIERTGTSLPAGTVITLRTQGIGGNYEITAPDNAWTYTRLNPLGNNLNLNAGGDQLIFLQGGNWFDGTSSGFGGFSHDATYTGGRFLLAFNTSDSWNPWQDSSQESGLPPAVATCQSQTTSNGPADFLAYVGPLEAAAPPEWSRRLTDSTNWQSFPTCTDYPAPPTTIAVLTNEMGIDCRDCGSCEAYDEMIYFRLPATGGPFEVVYTKNQDTLTATNVQHRDSLPMLITANTSVALLSLTNAAGCTFTPRSNNGFVALIEPLRLAYQVNGSACDTSCYTVDFTFQGNGPFLLRYYFSHQDSSQARDLIALTNERSLDICPGELPDDQGPIELILLRLKDLNCTLPLGDRLEVSSGGAQVFDLRETLCEDELRTVNGTVYDVNTPFGREIIPGGAANGCDSIINVALTFTTPPEGRLSGDATICAGQSATLTIQLADSGQYTVEIRDDRAGSFFLANVQDGEQLEVAPAETTTYTLSSIASATSACTVQPDQSVTIAVSDFALELRTGTDYNGFGVSCADASDGALSVSLNGGTAPFTINWSTGETRPEITDLAPGIYEVSVQDDAGCSQGSSYTLSAPPAIQVRLGQDSSGCGGNATALRIEDISGGLPPYEYSTDDQFFSSIAGLPFTGMTLDPGSYTLTVQDLNDCPVRRNLTIGNGTSPGLNLGPDLTLTSGDSVVIEASSAEAPAEIAWINAEAATFLTDLSIRVRPQRTQTYGLRLQYPNGCIAEDYLTVFVEQTKDYYTPNAFSPNEDGINDRFTVFGGSQIRQINYLRVFSRWGQLLFEQRGLSPNAPFEGWDGSYRGQAADSGAYLFSAELEYQDGRREVVSGTFVLLR